MKHDSIKILLDSLERETGKRLGHSELARALNVSEQVVTNWAKRGISVDGALAAQMAFQRDANFILGRLPNPIMQAQPSNTFKVSEDIKPYLPSPAWPFKSLTTSQWTSLADTDKELIESLAERLLPI